MSEQRQYGVECKTKDCNYGIILGDYMTQPQQGGDVISFVVLQAPTKFRCPACDQEHEYTQTDLRMFPKDAENEKE
jgi:hypothetical protein